MQTELPEAMTVLERLSDLPFTRGNRAQLLIDGEETFAALFAAMDRAERYILVQFYILREDQIGKRFVAKLEERAEAGVRICLLYDEIGCGLENSTIARMRGKGIQVSGFNATKGRVNRFQLNFRNHRKIVVVDGREAFLGGLNVGDEYLGRDKSLSPWRDTFLGLAGPSALAVQLSFQEDWYWATGEIGDWNWTPEAVDEPGTLAFVLPSGPADELETCALFFVHAINSARKRIWLSTPYFVPDDKVIQALALASLRGVDVRILLPGVTDLRIAKLAGLSYIEEVLRPAIKMFRYRKGFIHQKVLLLDDNTACIGTANFDNRSFRLNFEITGLVIDPDFARKVETMLERDFAASDPIGREEFVERSFAIRLASRVARLFAPIL